MSSLPSDRRILFARRDRAEYPSLHPAFEAPFEYAGARWPSVGAWAESRAPRPARPAEHRDALRAQYAQHPEMCLALLATGDAELVDDSAPAPATAPFVTGTLLMALRAELASEAAARSARGQPSFLDELVAGLGWLGP